MWRSERRRCPCIVVAFSGFFTVGRFVSLLFSCVLTMRLGPQVACIFHDNFFTIYPPAFRSVWLSALSPFSSKSTVRFINQDNIYHSTLTTLRAPSSQSNHHHHLFSTQIHIHFQALRPLHIHLYQSHPNQFPHVHRINQQQHFPHIHTCNRIAIALGIHI